jgi:hypothetical protein
LVKSKPSATSLEVQETYGEVGDVGESDRPLHWPAHIPYHAVQISGSMDSTMACVACSLSSGKTSPGREQTIPAKRLSDRSEGHTGPAARFVIRHTSAGDVPGGIIGPRPKGRDRAQVPCWRALVVKALNELEQQRLSSLPAESTHDA